MIVRLGIIISSFITLAISFLLLYISINVLPKFPLFYIGIAVSIALVVLCVTALLGRRFAFEVLSIFYFILALAGILLAFNLPPEGLLIALPSLATGTYLWRYGKYREEGLGEGPCEEAGEEISNASGEASL